jgi:threonine synthase
VARATGVFGEPAGVTAMAGVIKMKEEGQLDRDERAVALVTGHGLKDIDSALKAAQGAPIMVEPDIEDVAAKLAA